MPNYSLTIDSKFKPFSFERYIQPYEIYGKAYREQEDTLSELATKANIWEEMANEQTDPQSYAMYKTYSEDLRKQADQLAKEGLTPGSRRGMLNMRERYTREILPIEQAYKRRQELSDEQRKLLSQDNTLLFDRDMSTLSLDDLIKNPQLTYRSYSGTTLAKQVESAAKNLAKEMRENPREWRSILKDSYYEALMQRGFRSEDVLKVLQDNSDASSILKNIIEDAVSSSGIAKWNNQDALDRAYEYARQGTWSSVGDTQYQVLDNWRAKLAAQEQMKIREEIRRGANSSRAPELPKRRLGERVISGASGKISEDVARLGGIRITPSGISTVRLDEKERALKEANLKMQNFSQEDIYKIEDYIKRKESGQTKVEAVSIPGMGYKNIEEPAPKGYYDYRKAKRAFETARKDYEQELQFINDFRAKYAHLDPNPSVALIKGMNLEEKQQKEESSYLPLSAKGSTYNEVRKWLVSQLSSATEEDLRKGVIEVVNADTGKPLSPKKVKQLIDEGFEKSSIRINKDKDKEDTNGLQIVEDGVPYVIRGFSHIDAYNKTLKETDKFLKDFSAEIIDSITPITDDDLVTIAREGVQNLDVEGMNIKNIPGTDFYGTTLYNENTGTFIKIIFNANGDIVAKNSLGEELNEGTSRDRSFLELSDIGLNSLIGTATQD